MPSFSLSLSLSLSTKVTFLSFKVAAEAGLDSKWSGRGEIGVGTTDSDGLSLRLPCLSLSLSNCLSVSHISLSQWLAAHSGTVRHHIAQQRQAQATIGHRLAQQWLWDLFGMGLQWDLFSDCEISGVVVLLWGLWCGSCYGVVVILQVLLVAMDLMWFCRLILLWWFLWFLPWFCRFLLWVQQW